jgi:hypothetical protein
LFRLESFAGPGFAVAALQVKNQSH